MATADLIAHSSPKDVCRCGDYREQHTNGTGRCMLGNLCTPRRCSRFRLFTRAPVERRIVTSNDLPPIPDRRFDWMAYRDGDEEGPRGFGATEALAIADLRMEEG